MTAFDDFFKGITGHPQALDSRLSQELVDVQATADGLDRDVDLQIWIEETVTSFGPQIEGERGRKRARRSSTVWRAGVTRSTL